MRDLLESIREVGIKVPLSVYPDRSRYVLIDGERRRRCAKKLNFQEVPAIVQPKPGKLENLLMMFNIHNVRLQWDSCQWRSRSWAKIQRLLEKEEEATTPAALAGVTGLSVPTVRRALELLELPQKYQDLLLREAEKPPGQQRVTADLFVEINKSQRVVENYLPEVFAEVTERQYVDAMVRKYLNATVKNVVRFRDISKIARAELAGEDPGEVAPEIVRLVQDPSYTIDVPTRRPLGRPIERETSRLGPRASPSA